jgi:hypothetical protein
LITFLKSYKNYYLYLLRLDLRRFDLRFFLVYPPPGRIIVGPCPGLAIGGGAKNPGGAGLGYLGGDLMEGVCPIGVTGRGIGIVYYNFNKKIDTIVYCPFN